MTSRLTLLSAIGVLVALCVPAAAQRGACNGSQQRIRAGTQQPAGPARGACNGSQQRGRAGAQQRGGPACSAPPQACRGVCRTNPAVPTATASREYRQRLQTALGEEVFARDLYEAAAQQDGRPRYRNLVRAEQNHVEALKQAITLLGDEPGAARARDLPAIDDVESQAAELERAAIERFEGLIADCPDPGVLAILQNLQAANRRHLAAATKERRGGRGRRWR